MDFFGRDDSRREIPAVNLKTGLKCFLIKEIEYAGFQNYFIY